MDETQTLSQNGIGADPLDLIRGLLTGETLAHLRREITRFETESGRMFGDVETRSSELLAAVTAQYESMTARLEQLADADRTIVRQALKEMLSVGKIDEFPMLREIVLEETPQHKNMPLLMAAMRARIPVWIYGDTGSGKTTATSLASQMLGLPFRFISVAPTTTKSEFMGYRDAGGVYRSTGFREAYEHGGTYLIDEIDNGNTSILAVLNTALANNQCAFPDGIVRQSDQLIVVAAANTIGKGANMKYIGRNAFDVTTLDRFVFVRMDIDENLESALAGGSWDQNATVDIAEGGLVKPEKWLKFVRKVRRACNDLGLMHVVSPRATFYGLRLIEVGVGKTHLEDMCIWKGIRETDKEKVLRKVR